MLTRRNFLRTTLGTVAAAVVAPVVITAALPRRVPANAMIGRYENVRFIETPMLSNADVDTYPVSFVPIGDYR